MISIKTLKRKNKVQLLLTYVPFLASLVISYADVMPQYSIGYKVPTILLLLIVPLLYSYNFLYKNYLGELENENNSLKELVCELNISTKTSTSISLDDYSFDSKIGYYKHKETGELFCSRCLLKNIPAQLQEYDNYWRCINCSYPYNKPGYKPELKQKRIAGDNFATRW